MMYIAHFCSFLVLFTAKVATGEVSIEQETENNSLRNLVVRLIDERLQSVYLAVEQLQNEFASDRSTAETLITRQNKLRLDLDELRKCVTCKQRGDLNDNELPSSFDGSIGTGLRESSRSSTPRAEILDVEQNRNAALELSTIGFSGEIDPSILTPTSAPAPASESESTSAPVRNPSPSSQNNEDNAGLSSLIASLVTESMAAQTAEVNQLKQNVAQLRKAHEALAERQTNSSSSLLTKLVHSRTECSSMVTRVRQELDDATRAANRSLVRLKSEVMEVSNRYLTLEVRSLNRSLETCQIEKVNIALESRSQQLALALHALNERVTSVSNRTDKIDRSLRSFQLDKDRLDLALENITSYEYGIVNLLVTLPKDCDHWYENGARRDGAYFIRPFGRYKPILVQCQFKMQSGWTVIQQRNSGNLMFNRTWAEYATGFGDRLAADSEYWLGNRYLHTLTVNGSRQECDSADDRLCAEVTQLRVEMWDIRNVLWVATYSRFEVASEKENQFRLLVDGFEGNATDSLAASNMTEFSTSDKDNDLSAQTNCARTYSSGWWYRNCHEANLNAQQFAPEQMHVGMWMHQRMSNWLFLKKVTMMIRKTPRRLADAGVTITSFAPIVTAEVNRSEARTVANQIRKEKDRVTKSRTTARPTATTTTKRAPPAFTTVTTTATTVTSKKTPATTSTVVTTSTRKAPTVTTTTATSTSTSTTTRTTATATTSTTTSEKTTTLPKITTTNSGGEVAFNKSP